MCHMASYLLAVRYHLTVVLEALQTFEIRLQLQLERFQKQECKEYLISSKLAKTFFFKCGIVSISLLE